MIGLDPGRTGGISVIDRELGKLYMHEIPVIGKVLDCKAVGDIFKIYAEDSFCVMENIHAIANVPATTNFSLGNTCGIKLSLSPTYINVSLFVPQFPIKTPVASPPSPSTT